MEHKLCKDCKNNNYPTCSGIIMFDGLEMNIENLKESFRCGGPVDFSISKTEIQKLKERIEILEEVKVNG